MRNLILMGLLLLASRAGAQNVVEAVQRPDDVYNVAVQGGFTVNIGTDTVISISTSSTIATRITLESQTTSISVSGGTGFGVLTSTGIAVSCGILAVSDTAQYKFSMVTNDADEYPIFGSGATITGDAVVRGEFYMVSSSKVVIEQATEDGVYKVRCPVRK